MAKSLRLKSDDYKRIDEFVKPVGEEYYTVVTTALRGQYIRSIHVFSRQPMTKEMTEFENTASRMKFKGSRAELEGSQLLAYKRLYDLLIVRAYDVPVGMTIYGETKTDDKGVVSSVNPLNAEDARRLVPLVMKREALRDSMDHMSENRVAEDEGEEEVKGVVEE